MPLQVEIGSVSNSPQFAPAEREQVFKVCRRIAVVRQFFLLMIAGSDIFHIHIQRFQEIDAVLLPVIEPFQISARLAEEFQFHLLEPLWF